MGDYHIETGWSVVADKSEYQVGEEIALSVENCDVCFDNMPIITGGLGVLFHVTEVIDGNEVFVSGAEDRILGTSPGLPFCAMYSTYNGFNVRGMGWIPCGPQVQGGRTLKMTIYASVAPPANNSGDYIQL